MKTIKDHPRLIVVLILFCTFLWGTAIPVTKLSFQEMGFRSTDIFNRIFYAGIRFFLAGLVVTAIYRVRYPASKRQKLTKKERFQILRLALLRTSLLYVFYYIGLSNTASVKASILQSTDMFVVVILSHFFVSGERLTKGKALAVLLGFLGVLMTSMGKDLDFNFKLAGEGLLMLSVTCGSIATILMKRETAHINPVLLTSHILTWGAVPILGIGFAFMERPLVFTPMATVYLLYVVFVSVFALTVWNTLLQIFDAGAMSVYRLFIPIFGSIVSVFVMPSEKFTINLAMGLVMVVAGIIVLNRAEVRKVQEVHDYV